MKQYFLKDEGHIDLKEEKSINGRNIRKLTVYVNIVCQVKYCEVSTIVNHGELHIAYSMVDDVLGNGKIYACHSSLNRIMATFASIDASYAKVDNKNCQIVGGFSKFYHTIIDNPKSVFEDCQFNSCDINAGYYKNCMFLDSCRISRDAIIVRSSTNRSGLINSL